MNDHSWEIIIGLSTVISSMAGWFARYLLKELDRTREALNRTNEVNAKLAEMVPSLIEQMRKGGNDHGRS